jgi:hypothetical protein
VNRLRATGLAFAAALLLAAFQLATVRLGADYGTHWDEHFLQTLLGDSVTELSAWPRKYFYGSLYAAAGYVALAPDWLDSLPRTLGAARRLAQYTGRLEPDEEIRAVQAALHERIQSPAFLVRTRMVFASFATLGVLAMFSAGRRLGRGPWSGVLAAAALALSWQLNTHARHIAVDAMLVALVAAFLALLARFLAPKPGERPERWLFAAAVCCGFATGTKFQALLLLAPLLAAVVVRRDRAQPARTLRRAALCVGIAAFVTLAVNPGLIFDTVQVATDWGYTAKDYFRSSQPLYDPYRSPGGLFHLREATVYVVAALLSPWTPLAAGLFGAALFGVAANWERDRGATLAIALFVPVYVLALSSSALVIVRNYLPVLPALALCLMWGLEAFFTAGRARRALAAAVCAAWAAVNGTHIVTTALSVRRDWNDASLARAVQGYIEAHPDERFLVSRRLATASANAGVPLLGLPNARSIQQNGDFDCLVYLPAEYRGQLPGATRIGYFRAVFGSREVDYDYYPDWIGRGLERRAYALDAAKARPLLEALGQ